jgi:hypothetical protein
MSKISSACKDEVDSDCPSGCSVSSSSISYEHKVRIPTNPKEELFLKRAIQFLKSIETRTHKPSSSSSSEDSQGEEMVDLRANLERNDRSSSSMSDKLSRRSSILSNKDTSIQEWISSKGNQVKSYRHCLNNNSTDMSIRQLNIDLSDAPPYLRPGPFKDAMNEEFASKYPELPNNLTLSKIVNLREDLIQKLCRPLDIEACTMAMALTYFERLLNMNLITKYNRKLYGAICVLLAFKFNEETHLDECIERLKILMDTVYNMDKSDLLTHKDLIRAEFHIYASLGFSLLLSVQEFEENFNHVISRLDVSPLEYLGRSISSSGLLRVPSHLNFLM